MAEIKAVIFDAGGVLHERNTAIANDMATELKLSQDALRAIGDNQMPLLGVGKIDELEFWRQVREEYGVRKVSPAENLLGRAFAETLTPHDDVLTFVKILGAHGIKLAVLSNTIEPHARAMRASGQFEPFDRVLLSNEIGMRKPDPAVYRFALHELDVLPEEAVLIDDDRANVDAARALQINGIQYSSYDSMVDALTRIMPELQLWMTSN